MSKDNQGKPKNQLKELTKKYPFLKEIVSQSREEIEVTEEAVLSYQEKYDYLGEYRYKEKRIQMTSRGACLHKALPVSINEDSPAPIDIVGDVLTAKSVFVFIENNRETLDDELVKLYDVFCELYHSIGNLMPIGEGCNIGGGSFGTGVNKEGIDHFSRKLKYIKQVFDKGSFPDNDIDEINKIIRDKKTLGRKCKKCLHYWIKTEWINKDKSWENFVTDNYLFDMVNENFQPISWSTTKENRLGIAEEGKDVSAQKSILVQCIKMIICRGYRIWNENHDKNLEESDNEVIKEIMEKIGLQDWIDREISN